METVLLFVAVLAWLVAAGLSVTIFLQLRQQHDEAAGRVEALRTLAFAEAPTPVPVSRGPLRELGPPADESETMFGGAAEPGAPARRWLALAAVALVMILMGGAIYAIYAPNHSQATNAASVDPTRDTTR